MGILIVDDSKHVHAQLKAFLNDAGITELFFADSAFEALDMLGLNGKPGFAERLDLILMDIEMDEMNGIEVTRKIRAAKETQNIPVLMVTADISDESLQEAFTAGAVDYITKPIRKAELLARIRSFLKLKQETDARKAKQKELIELADILFKTNAKLKHANEKLKRASLIDGLTGIYNRRYFDETLEKEWRRLCRASRPVSLMMIDIDFFKLYNDMNGHQAGDQCLKRVAGHIDGQIKRSSDFVARYGGEEFAVVLPETDIKGADILGRMICEAVEASHMPHPATAMSQYVTVSIGIAGMIPQMETLPDELIVCADKALYRAKAEGRNRICTIDDCKHQGKSKRSKGDSNR
jgi:diguanylate cyclase (GGDEF)-like protein